MIRLVWILGVSLPVIGLLSLILHWYEPGSIAWPISFVLVGVIFWSVVAIINRGSKKQRFNGVSSENWDEITRRYIGNSDETFLHQTDKPEKKKSSKSNEAPREVDLDSLTDIKNSWARLEVLKLLTSNPTQQNLKIIEKAINILIKHEFKPYRKNVDSLDPNSACQGILYYAKVGVFKEDPYAVQALIPHVGSQTDFLSRQLRSMENGDWYYAIYQLLEAQLNLSKQVVGL
jgi:hypothetical protein